MSAPSSSGPGMDEAQYAPWHRWLAFCRMLMLHHPRVGARDYARNVDRLTDTKLGWNAIHPPEGSGQPVRYMRVDPKGGELTKEKPDIPDEQLNHVYESEMPPLEGSSAWLRAVELAEIVSKRNEGAIDANRVTEVMERILTASRSPLRGTDPWVEKRLELSMASVKGVFESREKLLLPLLDLARDVVRDCLEFQLTVCQAANVLAALLFQYARLPSPVEAISPPARIFAVAEHLIARSVALSRERSRHNLTSYYDASYLALLYGDAAVIMLQATAAQLPEGSDERGRFEDAAKYIDEYMAHELSPCLMHPIDYVPFGLSENHHASTVGIVNATGLYPGAGAQGTGPVDFQTLWPKIQAHSAQAKEVDIAATLEAENDPVSMDEKRRLMVFLQTLKLGEGRG